MNNVQLLGGDPGEHPIDVTIPTNGTTDVEIADALQAPANWPDGCQGVQIAVTGTVH